MTELQSVTLTRHYAIGPNRLFEILSTPSYLQQWFYPSPEIRMEVEEQTLKVGGHYRFLYHQPDGTTHVVIGEYCAVEPPGLLAFTWGWEAPDEHAGISTLVTLSLVEKNGGCELTVLHEQLHAGEMLDRHSAGWQGTLDNLQVLIEQ